MPYWRIVIQGTVQGVGFRPFVKRLADRRGLEGVVYNTGDGVVIELRCGESSVTEFADALQREKPPLAMIAQCRIEPGAVTEFHVSGFNIESSRPIPGAFTLISPDIATCEACLAEMRNPPDRRFGYAFTNCTNCGPRYTIVRETPYDRANTTMAPFTMCEACASEYQDPRDRRFHAEPTACPACGPKLSEAMPDIIAALAGGEIVAVKGVGGFQLACDALSNEACSRLRSRKRRSRKPFALMFRNVRTVEKYCMVRDGERELLDSRAAPIVLLELLQRSLFPDAVAPGLDRIGVMLPNTPMHHQFFDGSLECLVMTSGNITEEPIVIENSEARAKLAPLVDRFLLHDRDIYMRADDSVVRWHDGAPRMIRRARGYAPEPIDLGVELGDAMGVGAELKNTFCLLKSHYAILSQHVGDLENLETQRYFEETLHNLRAMYRSEPRVLGYDLHPNYLSTRWAMAQAQPKIGVQHHHAHIASCMAENGLDEPVIGIAWDGTGYGTDAQIWGGEFLVCDFTGFRRAAHLRYVPLIGGDRASREGWRPAAAHLFDAFGDDYPPLAGVIRQAASTAWWKTFDQLLARHSVQTSSTGRLFDAVAALSGICMESTYEGEAAMLLEAAATGSHSEEIYPFLVNESQSPWTVDTRPIIKNIAQQCIDGLDPRGIAAAFHRTLAHIIKAVSARLRDETRLNTVCLSGGTFQNATLLSHVLPLLRAEGFEVFQHSRVPANDGGISLGQAVIAATVARGRVGATPPQS
jgi:hydrogenase maturation protein HypF